MRLKEFLAESAYTKFMALPKETRDSAIRANNPGVPITIAVSTALKILKNSTLSQQDEDSIRDALLGHKPTDVLSLKDLDQISAIADVDVHELRDLLGF